MCGKAGNMKHIATFIIIIVVIILAIFLSSCSTLSYTSTVPEFSSLLDINTWIYRNMEYDNVDDDEDTVQPAEVSLSIRRGTCYDYCVLFIHLAKENGWTVKLYPVSTKTGYHMIIDAGSLGYYDPTNNKYLAYTLPSGWSKTTM